jgi:hypothetical protein
MPIYQAYNRKIGAWVKYEFTKGGFRVKNVKERNPKQPFTGVPMKGQKPKRFSSRRF